MKQYKQRQTKVKEELVKVTEKFEESSSKLNAIAAEYGQQHFIDVIFPQLLELCPEDNLTDIDTRKVQIKSELEAIVDNPGIKERFDAVTKELEQLSIEKENLQVKLTEVEESFEDRSEEWIKQAEAIATKLDKLFCEYMEAIGFRGHCELRKIGTVDEYELQLKVSFTNTDTKLVDLTKNRHSGGERAVSTVMYLMGLQDLTCSPFRVVDEINQGMDERNERLVLDRIVKSCCGDANKPQYFVVTPKLLQGLRSIEHDDVTVLIVFNGAGLKRKWDFPQMVDKIVNHKIRK